jgi:hypothetical protein
MRAFYMINVNKGVLFKGVLFKGVLFKGVLFKGVLFFVNSKINYWFSAKANDVLFCLYCSILA